MVEKRRDIFISNRKEENANDADFWEWLDEEDEKEYESLRKKGKLVETKEGPEGDVRQK